MKKYTSQRAEPLLGSAQLDISELHLARLGSISDEPARLDGNLNGR